MKRDVVTKRLSKRPDGNSIDVKNRKLSDGKELSQTSVTPGQSPDIPSPTMPEIYKRIFNQTINTKFEKRRASNESNTLPALRGPELIKTLPTPRAQDTSIGVIGKKVGLKPVKTAPKQDEAVIHVIDDSDNRIKRTVQVFKCPKALLLRHMTYFREQLDEKNKNGLESGIDV